jgi:hypothetical protein
VLPTSRFLRSVSQFISDDLTQLPNLVMGYRHTC